MEVEVEAGSVRVPQSRRGLAGRHWQAQDQKHERGGNVPPGGRRDVGPLRGIEAVVIPAEHRSVREETLEYGAICAARQCGDLRRVTRETSHT
jgi:hypothetical protein